jgi:hypothetical protein
MIEVQIPHNVVKISNYIQNFPYLQMLHVT